MDAEAFEVNKDDLSNGIFISYLKQRLCEDEKVTVMLDRVTEGKSPSSFLFHACILPSISPFIHSLTQQRTISIILH